MKIGATTNAPTFAAGFRRAAQRRPVGTAIALTRVAKSSERDLVQEMTKVFDRPTAYTLSGTFTRPATADKLISSVGLKNMSGKGTPASEFLGPQIVGGGRNLTRFEKALAYKGYLPSGMNAVPGIGAKIDGNGNMSAGQITQILSVLGAFSESGYKANRRARSARRSKKQAQYFVGKPGNGRLPLGVWQRLDWRSGSEIQPVLI